MTLPHELQQRAEDLAQQHPKDIVAVYGLDQKCIWASPSHLDILGYSQAEMVGHHWAKFVAPEDHAHADLTGSDAFLNGRSIEVGLRAATRTGERVSIRGRAWIGFDPEAGAGYLFFQAAVV